METKSKAPKNKTKIILILLGGLAAVCVLCVGGSFAMDALGLLPTNAPTAIPTQMSTPTLPATITATAIPTATITPIPLAVLTEQAAVNAATEIASYREIDGRELLSYADQHVGEHVKVKIEIFNIISNEQLQGYFIGTFDALFVVTREPFSGIYEDDIITVYGTVSGTHCGTNAYGAEICQPLLEDAFYTK
jgi:hypothetical protein